MKTANSAIATLAVVVGLWTMTACGNSEQKAEAEVKTEEEAPEVDYTEYMQEAEVPSVKTKMRHWVHACKRMGCRNYSGARMEAATQSMLRTLIRCM